MRTLNMPTKGAETLQKAQQNILIYYRIYFISAYSFQNMVTVGLHFSCVSNCLYQATETSSYRQRIKFYSLLAAVSILILRY
jgi:hypothetical protein